jgi:hypothetical protein
MKPCRPERTPAERWVAAWVCSAALVACTAARPAVSPASVVASPPDIASASGEPSEPLPPPPPEGAAPGALATLPSIPASLVVRRALPGGLSVLVQALGSGPSPDGVKTREVAAGRVVFVLEIEGLASSSDGEKTGLARVAAEAWLDEQFPRAALLARGGDVWLWHGFDNVRLVVAVPPAGLERSLEELREALGRSRFSPATFRRVLDAERVRLATRLDADDAFVAEQLLHQRLFRLPVSLHPFASLAPTEAELDRLSGAASEANALLRSRLDIGNMRLVVLTAVRGDGAAALSPTLDLVARAFAPPSSSARGGGTARTGRSTEAPALAPLTAPFPPDDVRISMADRTDSASVASGLVTLRLAFGGIPRSSLAFGSWLVAAPLLEAALRADPRVGTDARVRLRLDIPRGGVPLEVAFTAPGDDAAPALLAAQEVIAQVGSTAPSAAALADAKRQAMFALATAAPSPDGTPLPPQAEPAFRLLDELVEAREVDADDLRKRVAAVLPAGLSADLGPLLDVPPVIVAVGEPRPQAERLAKVHDVDVFDPKRNFTRVRSVLHRATP